LPWPRTFEVEAESTLKRPLSTGVLLATGLPYALHVASASPHEVKLVRETLNRRFLSQLPERIIGDKAYDSDPLDRELAALGVERSPLIRGIE